MKIQSPSFSKNFFTLKVSIYDTKIVSLLDSGSNMSLLSFAAFKNLGQPNIKRFPSKCKLINSDGNPIKVMFDISVPIEIDSVQHICKLTVVEKLNWDLILGTTFMSNFRICLDFSQKSVTLNGRALSQVNCITGDEEVSKEDDDSDPGYNGLSPDQKAELQSFMDEYGERFEHVTGKCTSYTAKLRLKDPNVIVHKKQYFLPGNMLNALRKEVDEMLANDIIEVNHNSPYNNPCFLVKKPESTPQDPKFRVVVDCRELNKQCVSEHYALPNIDSILSSLRGATYFTKLDMTKAFWQIPYDEESRKYTAFSIPGINSFVYKRLLMGQSNSMQIFSRALNKILLPVLGKICFNYADDVIIYSKSDDFSSHLRDIATVLDIFIEHNLKINVKKSRFAKRRIKFLGYIVSKNELRACPEKVKSIVEMPRPKNAKTLLSFLAMCNYFRKLIPGFSHISAPMYQLLKKDVKWNWTAKQEDAFNRLKSALVSAPVVQMMDFTIPMVLWTDASGYGLSGILLQNFGNEKEKDYRVVSYASRSLSPHEARYSSYELEALATVFALTKFRPYLACSAFPITIVTDNMAVSFLKNCKNPKGRVLRWLIFLNSHDLVFQFRKGKLNYMSDLLSRSVENQIKDSIIENPFTPKLVSQVNPIEKVEDFEKTVDQEYIRLKQNVLNHPDSYPLFSLKNNLLMKRIKNKDEWINVYVVPQDFREEIISHEHKFNHNGYYKTYQAIIQQFYWRKMSQEISNYIRRCKTCQLQKVSHDKPNGSIDPVYRPMSTFSTWHLDFIGPMPRSSPNSYVYVLVAVCPLTRYVVTYPTRRATADVTIKCLTNLFYRFGAPEVIQTDNASNFKSNNFESFLQASGVTHLTTAPYSPQSCRAERSIQSIKQGLRCYLDGQQKKWEQYLEPVVFEINQSQSETTKHSPHELIFGKKLKRIGDIIRDIDSDRDKYDGTKSFEQLNKKLKNLHLKAEEFCLKQRTQYAKQYNSTHKDHRFNVNDLIFKRTNYNSDKSKNFCAKLAPRYHGPFIISKILDNNRYEVSNINKTETHVVNSFQIKPAFE